MQRIHYENTCTLCRVIICKLTAFDKLCFLATMQTVWTIESYKNNLLWEVRVMMMTQHNTIQPLWKFIFSWHKLTGYYCAHDILDNDCRKDSISLLVSKTRFSLIGSISQIHMLHSHSSLLCYQNKEIIKYNSHKQRPKEKKGRK